MNPSFSPQPDPVIVNPPTAAAIETWLIEQLAACLNTPIEDIDPEVPFGSYGLDSAEAVGLSGELEDWLQRQVSPTLLYDYPTVAALAEHLGTQALAAGPLG